MTPHNTRWPHEAGATMIEYVLMVSLVALVVIAGAIVFGESILGLFNTAADSIS